MSDQTTPPPYPLNIFCNNVHRTGPITHSILTTLSKPDSTTDIVIITEPWIGTVRPDTQEKGTNSHPDWICITPPQIINAGVTLYHKKQSNLRVVPLHHVPYANNHVLPVLITKQDFEITLIAVYNPPSSFAATNALITHDIPESPTILCGDFNLHAHDWDNKVTNMTVHATTFLDWLMENELQVLNDPNTPTYHGHSFQHNSIIDLVFANKTTSETYDLSPVQVHTEDHFASDHYPISFQIATYSPSLEPNSHPKLSENNKDEWINTLKPRVDQIMRTAPTNPSSQQIDNFMDNLIKAITSTTDQVTKTKKQRSHHAKHWWNDDLTATLTDLRQLSRAARNSRNPYLTNHYKRTKAVFQAKIKHAKRNWANERLEGATSKTVWDFIRCTATRENDIGLSTHLRPTSLPRTTPNVLTFLHNSSSLNRLQHNPSLPPTNH
jgi:hypothetical protein